MDELVKRLREIHPEEFGDAWDFAFACQQAMREAADAIEKLAAFKAQIMDGRFYVYKFGTLFELSHDPRDITVKFQYPEPPKEESDGLL